METLKIFKPRTLKEYLEFYKQFGFDEIGIVEIYISDMHLETEYSEMAIRLTAKKLRDERERFSRAASVMESVPMIHLESYTFEENRFLDTLTKNLALRPEDCLKYYEKEIREKIPNMLMPSSCFVDVIAIINYKYKVRFKNQKDNMYFINLWYKKLCDLNEETKNENK